MLGYPIFWKPMFLHKLNLSSLTKSLQKILQVNVFDMKIIVQIPLP